MRVYVLIPPQTAGVAGEHRLVSSVSVSGAAFVVLSSFFYVMEQEHCFESLIENKALLHHTAQQHIICSAKKKRKTCQCVLILANLNKVAEAGDVS